jgi:uncharacterized membrane protein
MVSRRVSALLLLICLAGPASAKSYHFGQVEVDATVRQDSSMHVRESWEYVFSGDFHYAYRTMRLPRGTDIRNFIVSESGRNYVEQPGDSPGSYNISSGGYFRATWYYQASDESRTFTLDYDIVGAVVKHADYAELYWQFIGEDCDVAADSAHVSIRLPGSIPSGEIRVWSHGALWGFNSKRDGQADITCRSLPAHTMLEGRVLFPTGYILASPRHDGRTVLRPILSEEGQWAQDANRKRAAARVMLGLPAGITLFGILIFVVLYVGFGREYRLDNPPQYLREPLDGWTPNQVGYIWKWGSLNAQDLTATVMDLVRRGALKLIVRKEPHPILGGLLGDSMKDAHYLEWVADYKGELRSSEQYLIRDMLFRMRAPGDMISLEEFAKEGRAQPSESYARFKEWKAQAQVEAERTPVVDTDSKFAMAGGIGIGALMFLSTFLLAHATQAPVAMLPAFVGFALIPASMAAIRRRNPIAAIALHQWQAFRRYLTDFSQLRSYPPPAVVLWEQYLVFAVTLGVADEVIRQFRELYPHMPTDQQTGVFSNWVVDGGNPLSSIGSMESAFSSFGEAISTATSSFSSASGGGGGSSGGGGGGGGGGGAGAG